MPQTKEPTGPNSHESNRREDHPPPYSSLAAFVNVEYPHEYHTDFRDDQLPRFSWINDKQLASSLDSIPSLFAWSDTAKSGVVEASEMKPNLVSYPWPTINTVPVAYNTSEEELFPDFSWPTSSRRTSVCSNASVMKAIQDGDKNSYNSSAPFSMSDIIDDIDDTIEELYYDDFSQLKSPLSPSLPLLDEPAPLPLRRLCRTLPHPVPLSMPTAPSPPPSLPAPLECDGKVLRRRMSPRRESLRELRGKDSDACLQRVVEDRLSMYLDGTIFGVRVEKDIVKRKKGFRLTI